MDRKIIGENGEKEAIGFLTGKGFKIRDRNFRYRRAEIDLICLDKNTLVFVEVKKRKNNEFGFPEEFVSKKQQHLIMQASEQYIHAIDWHGNIRYDIIAITGTEIVHLQDVFY